MVKSNSQIILKLKDFKNFKGQKIFTFNKGLNLVEAPNSSGKTSLIEALRIFVSNVDLEKNLINKEASRSHLELLTDKEYELDLSIDDKTGKLEKRFTDSSFKESSLENLSFITEDHHIMQAALTKDFNIIKNWLVNLTDFPYYQKLYEITIKQIDTYKIEKNREQSDYFARKKQLLSLKSNLNSRKILLENLYQELIKESLEDDEVRSILDNEKNLSENLKEKRQVIRELETKISAYRNEEKAIKTQLIVTIENLKKMEYQETSIPEIIAKKTAEIGEFETKIKDIETYLAEVINDSNHLDTQISTLESLIQKHEKECPTCFSQITEDTLIKIKSDKKKEKEVLDRDIQSSRKTIESIDEKIKELEREIRLHQVKFPREKAQLEKEISQDERKIIQISKKIPELETDFEKYTTGSMSLEKEYKTVLSKATKLRNQLADTNEKVHETQDRLKEISRQIEEINQEIIGIDVKTKGLNKYDIFISKLDKILTAINERISYIQNEIIDSLNEELNTLLKTFSFAEIKEIFLDDDFNISIKRADNSSMNYSDLSMFERKTIGVVLAFILKQKFSDEFPFFVIDEYLNSLDEDRDKVALNYLKESNYYVVLTKSSIDENNKGVLTQDNIVHIKA